MVGFASNHRPNKADLMLGEKHISSRLMIQGHTISFVWIRHGTEESQQGPKKSSFKMLDWVESELHFIKNDNSHQVKAKLEQTYPKLATGGGFELLRSSVSPRDLDVIVPPNCGYCVPFLRDSSGLGQAIAYIILIQKDLDCKPL